MLLFDKKRQAGIFYCTRKEQAEDTDKGNETSSIGHRIKITITLEVIVEISVLLRENSS